MAESAQTPSSRQHNDYEANDPWPASTTRAVDHAAFEPHSHRRPSSSPRRRSRTPNRGLSFYEMLHEPPPWSHFSAPIQNSESQFPQHRKSRRRQASQRNSHGDQITDEGGLTEAVAPDPVPSESSPASDTSYRKETHLESAERYEAALPPTHSKSLALLYTLSNLILFSILGTLARLGVQWLTFYPGAPVTISNLWANFGGTLLMGFLTEDRALFHPDAKTKKNIPLYIGLSTGFCGSFTSFSTFMRDVFFAMSNSAPAPDYHPPVQTGGALTTTTPRSDGYSVNAVLAVVVLTVCVPCAALYLGAHIALGLRSVIPRVRPALLSRFLEPAIAFLGWGCWLGALFMAIWPPDRPSGPSSAGSWDRERWRGDALFAIVFAPIGCMLRWYTSMKLNPLIPSFPLGTFCVNMLGTAVVGMCVDFQRVPLNTARGMIGGGRVGCQVLQGIDDGICGTLTTVSTWIVELTTLRRRHAYIYGAVSVVSGIAMAVVIMGSVKWTLGWHPLACPTGNMG